jgi:hypothetical protein
MLRNEVKKNNNGTGAFFDFFFEPFFGLFLG